MLLRIGAFPQGRNASVRQISEQMAAGLKEFLRLPKSHEREKGGLECANCHSNRDPHRGLFGRDCSSCHELDFWRIARFPHPSPASKNCAQCHRAPPSHYMEHFVMMDKMITGQEHATVNQCFKCHRTGSFNDIKAVGWYKNHLGGQ